MSKLVTATLARSDDPEQIVQCIESLGRSAQRINVFEEIYRGQKKDKSVKEIMASTNLSERQVRKAIVYLADHHLCLVEGRGEGTRVSKDKFCKKHRDVILRGVRNPKSKEKILTKRARGTKKSDAKSSAAFRPQNVNEVRRVRRKSAIDLRVLFFTTNPSRDLRTDQEYRAVYQRWQASKARDRIDLNNVTAASFEDFIASINEISPDVIHFSGHGNDGLIIFDGDQIGADEIVVDFELLKKILGTSRKPPGLLVLNSCYGALSAETMLGPVGAIVAMSDTIDDTSAAFFSRQFYSSIFGGQDLVVVA